MTGTVDFDAFYSVKGKEGVAWTLRGWAKETREVDVIVCTEFDDPDHEHDESCGWVEVEEYDRDDMVEAVMVGDDGVHLIDVDDLVVITEDDFCHGCGQIGCGH
jgi:hypothetical protein